MARQQRDFADELEQIAQQLRRTEVRQLRDEMKLSFEEIGQRLGYSRQNAQKLYNAAIADSPATDEVPA